MAMRKKRVKVLVQEIEVTVYDSNKKEEKTFTAEKPVSMEKLPLAKGVVEISSKILGEREVVYSMSGEDFIKHATIEE